MLKKWICISGFALVFASHVWTLDLSFGLETGYSYNMLNTSTGYRTFTSYENRGGFMFGIPVLVSFNDSFALGSGLRYIQKNYRYERNFINDGFSIYSDFTNGFLQMPVFADYSLGRNNWRVFVNMGTTLGFWMHSSRKGQWMGISQNPFDLNYVQLETFSERVEFDETRDRRFESTLFTGLGFRYTIDSFTPFMSIQYNYGLTDLQKNYMTRQVARYNNTVTVQLGVLFNPSVFRSSR